jgi:hypothetical protein
MPRSWPRRSTASRAGSIRSPVLVREPGLSEGGGIRTHTDPRAPGGFSRPCGCKGMACKSPSLLPRGTAKGTETDGVKGAVHSWLPRQRSTPQAAAALLVPLLPPGAAARRCPETPPSINPTYAGLPRSSRDPGSLCTTSTVAFFAVNPYGVGRSAALTASPPVRWAGEVGKAGGPAT